MVTRTQMDETQHGTRAGDATRDAVYLYIWHYVNERGYAPCQREIARDCYYAQSTVRHALAGLAAEGRIGYAPRVARGITLKGAA